MVAAILKRFDPFTRLDAGALATAVKHARLIALPSNRWLLRRGRRLPRHLFLVDGEVEVFDASGRRRLFDGEIYRPGDDVALATRAATRILAVDLAPIEFLLQRCSLPLPVLTPVDRWLDRLLACPVVNAMPFTTWQRLLRSAKEQRVSGGQALVTEDAVYVVKSGVVERGGTLFEGGEYFGEDAALTRDEFTARYSVRCDSALLLIPGDAVRALIVDYPLPSLSTEFAQTLDLDRIVMATLTAHAERLCKDRVVVIRGGRAGQRAFAFTALTRMGFSAIPVG